MEHTFDRTQKIFAVRQSLIKVIRFLSNYLPLANAHSTDFITHNLWNSFLPDNIKDELKRLDDSELIGLLSDFTVPDNIDKGKEEESNLRRDLGKEFCDDGNPEMRLVISESGDDCEKWEEMCPYFNAASVLGDSSQRKVHSIKDCPPRWIHTNVSDFIKDTVANSLENLGVLSPLESVFPRNPHPTSQPYDKQTQEDISLQMASTMNLPSESESACLTKDQVDKLSSKIESVENGLAHIHVSKEKEQETVDLTEEQTQSLGPPSKEETGAESTTAGKDETPFVGYYMSEKKSHEVEVLSALCAHLVKEHRLDLAVDLGSGKGYLGTQLSRQFGIAVVGIDSSPGNTAGAERRRQVVDKQWTSLVQSAQEAVRTGKKVKKGKNWKSKQTKMNEHQKSANQPSGGGHFDQSKPQRGEVSSTWPNSELCGDSAQSSLRSPDLDRSDQDDAAISTECEKPSVVENMPQNSENVNSGDRQEDDAYTDVRKSRTRGCECDAVTDRLKLQTEIVTGDKQVVEGAMLDRSSDKDLCSKSKIKESNDVCCHCMAVSKDHQSQIFPLEKEAGTKTSSDVPNSNLDGKENSFKTTVQDSQADIESRVVPSNSSIYVPLTLYVDTAVSLTEVVKAAMTSHLGQVPGAVGRMLLTGLHTCGGLGASLPRLFLRSPEVQVLAYVGCCYNLLQESFAADPFADTAVEREWDFPLSGFLTKMGVGLGRTARNLASQSPHRILANREVPGRSFYKRALLEVMLREVTGGTQEWQGLRGVEARSKSLHQYVCRAFQRLGLTRHMEQLTESLVMEYDRRYGDQADKLAAFCQLKAALGPSLEAVMVLDRFLFLLEQPEVLDVKLVKLFDPVKSPRCYALVAVKQ